MTELWILVLRLGHPYLNPQMKIHYLLLSGLLSGLSFAAIGQTNSVSRQVLVRPGAGIFGHLPHNPNPAAGHRPSNPGLPTPASSNGDVYLEGGNVFGGSRDYGVQLFGQNTMGDGASLDLYPRLVTGNPERVGSIMAWSQSYAKDHLDLGGVAFQVNQLQDGQHDAYRECFTITKQGDIHLGGAQPAFPMITTPGTQAGALDGTRLFFDGGRDVGLGTDNTDWVMLHRYNEHPNQTTLRACIGDEGSRESPDKMEIGYYTHSNDSYTGWVNGVALYTNGQVFAHKVVVKEGAYPDYVFKPSYRLAPLAEVEQKIKELGHLPGMPSAEQVEKNGMDLGEQNRLLVEKVEELTLHLIQMRKELDEIKAAKK